VAHAAVNINTPPMNDASESHARMGNCLLEGPFQAASTVYDP
jgi:hypothetical protein